MYILNPRLAADVFEGEYIIANLDTGLYYSIQGIAVSLVSSLPFETPRTAILQLAEAFPDHSRIIEEELTGIFRQLFDEGIIKEGAPASEAPEQRPLPAQYAPSKFNRYADMQDLLLLDPVHDVDEEGWTVKNNE